MADSKINLEDLHEVYYSIADTIGLEDTVKLAESMRGAQIYFRTHDVDLDCDYQEIVECIGKEKTEKIIELFIGDSIYFPDIRRSLNKSKVYDEIRKAYRGYNLRELVKKYGYSARHIKNIVAGRVG